MHKEAITLKPALRIRYTKTFGTHNSPYQFSYFKEVTRTKKTKVIVYKRVHLTDFYEI